MRKRERERERERGRERERERESAVFAVWRQFVFLHDATGSFHYFSPNRIWSTNYSVLILIE
jgi:hypothetical protein